ncbi:MAG: hypothetical protein KC933_30375 [Myxococcales bacterium]|nr:hypothetical protein [Myxococcales bacterium]
MRFAKILLCALAGAIPTSSALAQGLGAGTGFPIGEKSRIHTGLDMSVGFDSNSLRFDNARDDQGQRSDWKAVIRPGVTVDVPGTSVELMLRGQLSIMQYFGTGALDRDLYSDTTFGGDVVAKLRLGSKDSIIGFSLENQLVRTPVWMDDPGTIPSDERRFPLWHNRGKALFTLRPGGRALELDLGYGIEASIYNFSRTDGTNTQTSQIPYGFIHSGIFEARWKFFPKTAFVFHADVGYFTASNQGAAVSTYSALPLHIYLGAIGQVTTRLNAEITVGDGDTLSSEGGNFTTRGPIGTAILTYAFNSTTNLSLGYRRTIQPEVIVNSYSSDAPFVRFKAGIGGRLVLSLFGEYQFRKYARSGTLTNGERINAGVAMADARVEYWFFPWLNAAISYRLQMQNPSTVTDEANNILLQDFVRHQAFLSVGFHY